MTSCEGWIPIGSLFRVDVRQGKLGDGFIFGSAAVCYFFGFIVYYIIFLHYVVLLFK